ncbi:MAG: hypothetical protein ACRBB0_23995 [Pelagimonas sp.]|uniref:hypothetical protein n=1 Tax=Pelagimonas sp. TaxID=2073170 RepID=UPI003D6B3F72
MNGSLSDPDLWSRISEYQFSPAGPCDSFEAHLCNVLDYEPDDISQMLFEYRRFAYLHLIAPRDVLPSSFVDEVWLQHSLMDHNEWNQICIDAIGQKLHYSLHENPTSESMKYQKTLELYQREFGQNPPDRIWFLVERGPPFLLAACVCFGLTCVAVVSQNYWLFGVSFLAMVVIIGVNARRLLATPRIPNKRSNWG